MRNSTVFSRALPRADAMDDRERAEARFHLVAGSLPAGLRARQPRPGPEENLVRQFLDQFPIASREGYRVTVFREPRLESGFPDLVVVIWDPRKTRPWTEKRRLLRPDDVRLLHLIGISGPLFDEELAALLGVRPHRSLDRLHNLDLIRSTKMGWRAEPVHRIFAVRRILAFEAKIGAITAALHQAALNRWFASESYVLLPRLPSIDLRARAHASGVGVWLSGASKPALQATRAPTGRPVSYASWLFNEWTWQHATTEAGAPR